MTHKAAVSGGLFAHGKDSLCISFGSAAAREIRAMLEKFMWNCLLWKGPHSIAEEGLLSLSKQKISSDELTKTPMLHVPVLSLGREGLGGKDVLKVSFTFQYPPLTLKNEFALYCYI